MIILTAIFNFMTDTVLPGAIWMITGLGVMIIMIEGTIAKRLHGREMPQVNLFFVVAILIIVFI
jgi:hypothetical protein